MWCVLCVLLSICGYSQTKIEADQLTIDDGLSQGFVQAILQDQEGFMWFGSKNGLNRYDGREFEIFTHDPDNPFSISNDGVTNIEEQGDFLLVGTYGTDLNLYHKREKRFYRIPLVLKDIQEFNGVSTIYKDSAGQFWLNTGPPHQLIRLHFPTDFWNEFPQEPSLLQNIEVVLVSNDFQQFGQSEDPNYLIIKSNDNNNCKKINIHTLETSALPTESPHSSLDNFYTQIRPKLGFTYSPNGDFLQLCRKANNQWAPISSSLIFSLNFYVLEKFNKILLINYQNNNLLLFDIDHLLNAGHVDESLAEYMVNITNPSLDLYIDRSNVIWIGTNGLGLRKISPRKLTISSYFSGYSISSPIIAFASRDFYIPGIGASPTSENSTNSKWTEDFIDNAELFKFNFLNQNTNDYWLTIVTESELIIYQIQDRVAVIKTQIPVINEWGLGELVMIQGLDQKLYISHPNFFMQYDPATNTHQLFKLELADKIIQYVLDFEQTINGLFWIATPNGLIKGQSDNGSFTFELVEAMRNDACASLLVDPKDPNILWIGTRGRGLARLDSRTMTIDRIDSNDGLPNNVIYAVLGDEAGNLWLSSNRGIIAYNPATGRIRNFTSADGMQSNEFNTLAYGKSPDGTLFFGGINGLNSFRPEDLRDNSFQPVARITQLAVNNEVIHIQDSTSILDIAIEYSNAITLDYSNNSISLSFAALEFTTPSKNTFSYYLEGAEEEWTHTTTENRASYLNLSPGSYTFKIKAANGDLVWGDQITSLDIIILPPWYRSNLAYALYGLLFILALWYSRRTQKKRLLLRYELAAEHKEAERLKELESFRSRFYTNITHEFRTPLTVILGTAERLEGQKHQSNPEKKQLSLIRRNGKNLLNLVNQLLDLSKVEHNKLEVNYQQGDILRFIRYILESYYSLANANNILLKLESNETEIWMDYDAEKLRQIISNLLSNAIKYTHSAGRVVLRIMQQTEALKIEVEDTGKGINPDQLPHIFERFHQADDDVAKAGGTGIGLALARELVHLLDGTIEAASEVGVGSVFTVILPIRQEAALQEFVALDQADNEQIEKGEKIEKVESIPSLPSLLIIEDNLDVVEYLSLCLESRYELAFAYNGRAGIDKAMELSPDLIVSDVMMPEKTGFEVTEILKQDERTSHIPIVLLTAKADLDSRLAGLKHGADVYLPKPFNQEELLVNLDNLLAIRKKLQVKYQQLALAPTDQMLAASADDQEQQFLEKLRQFLEQELDNAELKASDAAKAVGMSRSNLYAKLSAVTGLSFNLYLRSVRLQKAKQLLQHTSLSVSEIAYQVGFSRPDYFSKQFTRQFGTSPSSMRE
ncbi:MAG: ATP-binding protein [Bacteroidota bacterium]